MLTNVKDSFTIRRDSALNLQHNSCYICHCTLSMLLHYLVKLLLMVFVGVSKFRKTNLTFVSAGVEINGGGLRSLSAAVY